jgi:ribosomal protein S18 acetylase RimI-like enzyme
MSNWSITSLDEADQATADAVLKLLVDYNQPFLGERPPVHPVRLVARDAGGQLLGGLLGQIRVHWLHVDFLVAAPGHRRAGLGSALMAQAEKLARAQQCVGIWLDTFAFQAPGFYERLGFTRCGSIARFYNGHDRHFYEKRI